MTLAFLPPQQPGCLQAFAIGCITAALVVFLAFRTLRAWTLFRQRMVSGGYTWDELESMEREHYADWEEADHGGLRRRPVVAEADEMEE